MKNNLLFIILLLIFSLPLKSQQKPYFVSVSELIFSSAAISSDKNIHPKLRFTFFYHYGIQFHKDFGKKIGTYSAFYIRNVGYRSEYNDTLVKRRTYFLGLPLAFKIGDLENYKHIFFGAELDVAFHYKEKYKFKGSSTKTNDWFADQSNILQPSVFFGFSFSKDFEIYFKYYLENYLNKSYIVNGIKPYQDFDVNIWYMCLTIKEPFKKIKKTTEKGLLTRL